MGLGIKRFYQFVQSFPGCCSEWNTDYIADFKKIYVAVDMHIIIHSVFPRDEELFINFDASEEESFFDDVIRNRLAPNAFFYFKRFLSAFKQHSQEINFAFVYDGKSPEPKRETCLKRKRSRGKIEFFKNPSRKALFAHEFEFWVKRYFKKYAKISVSTTTMLTDKYAEGEHNCVKYLARKRNENNENENSLYAVFTNDSDLFAYSMLDNKAFTSGGIKVLTITDKIPRVYAYGKVLDEALKSIICNNTKLLSDETLTKRFAYIYIFCMLTLFGNDYLPDITGTRYSAISLHKFVADFIRSEYTKSDQILDNLTFDMFKRFIRRAAIFNFLKMRNTLRSFSYEKSLETITTWFAFLLEVVQYYLEAFDENSNDESSFSYLKPFKSGNDIKQRFTNFSWKLFLQNADKC